MTKWDGKIEGLDFVVCLGCGHRAKKLYRHIAKHGLTSKEYTAKYGPDAPLRSKAQAQQQNRARLARLSQKPVSAPAETKDVSCPSCETSHPVSKWMGRLHDLRCPQCKEKALEAPREVWGEEGSDYVVCEVCGHKAENLTSHIQNAHPGHNQGAVVALNSAVRDKTALKGRVLSAETRRKMSENAGRWNKGLTKADHPSLASASEKMRGKAPWSKGLSVDTDERLQRAREKLRLYVGGARPWKNGREAELTWSDFEPYLDWNGRLDIRLMAEETGWTDVTLRKYMKDFGLENTDKHVLRRVFNQVIRLDKANLESYKLGNGKVSIKRAMKGTGHCFPVIVRECWRHGLETQGMGAQQRRCLEAVSEALGGSEFKWEWQSRRHTNPRTGHMFKFDGYFPKENLIVEFHGPQHRDDSFRWNQYPKVWEAQQFRDAEKERQVVGSGKKFMVIWYDEPFEDKSYLRGRLVQLGIR